MVKYVFNMSLEWLLAVQLLLSFFLISPDLITDGRVSLKFFAPLDSITLSTLSQCYYML